LFLLLNKPHVKKAHEAVVYNSTHNFGPNADKWVTFASRTASLSQKECLVTTEEEAVGSHGRFDSGGATNICLFSEANPKYQVVHT